MSERRYRKGDRVRFRFGLEHVEGVVKEDRGPIGIGGRRLFLVEFPRQMYDDPFTRLELPAERLQLVSEAASAK
jgi:hypothetical protein